MVIMCLLACFREERVDFLVFISMSVACVFVCYTRKAAKFISVVFLLHFSFFFCFFAIDSVYQWKVLD